MATQNGDDLLSEFDSRIESLPASVDRAAVNRMQAVAYVLDDSIRIPGTEVRIGVDPILSVLPVAGDVVSGVFSMYIILESARLGVSFSTLLKMLANVAIDVVGGSVPLLGDIFDAFWKANKRNVSLALEELPTAHDPAEDDPGEEIEVTVE